ncbi:helix-turn-helix domain-containing protein [Leptospira alexanderi]|uniref:helix-turn-helix domain-containing protein n=1 Tax=Leptospira alexanderi TaxID=100053 RepID=UPI0009914C8E|nr:helix-turn-helix transcriptional regulator [Leptospira alexanderi]
MNSFDLKTQSGRLRLIIAETGMTQSRFGEEVGISKQQVSNILSGERDVSDPVALVIEHKFGFRKDWLLMKNGPQKNKMNAFDIAALDAENTFHRKLDRTSGVRKMIIDMIGRLLKGKK